MPLLIQPIDAIARAKRRDVLMLGPDRLAPTAAETHAPRSPWRTSADRQELIDWLDAQGIGWKLSGWPDVHRGDLYLDLPYDPSAPSCAALLDFVQEDAEGLLKWPGTRLYLVSLEWAEQQAPGNGDRT